MKSICNLNKARDSIFDKTLKYVAFGISDVLGKKINHRYFFEKDFLGEGMKVLFRKAVTGSLKVVVFNSRECDTLYGIWG